MGRFVEVKQMGRRGAWAMLAVMAIVALLGYQQYTWILKVADAEERMNREKLESSVKAFGDDFDAEITRAGLALSALTANSSLDRSCIISPILECGAKKMRQICSTLGLIPMRSTGHILGSHRKVFGW